MEKERFVVLKMIATVLISLAAVFVGMAAFLFLALGVGASLSYLALFAATFFCAVTIIIFLIWKPSLLKQAYYIPVVMVVVGAAALGFFAGRFFDAKAPMEGAAMLSERTGLLSDYEPFKVDAKIARLETRSTLELTEELPRLDCATALYPVAAAFVEAVYPAGDYPHNDPGGILCQTDTARAYDRLIRGEVDIILVAGPSAEQVLAAEDAGVALRLTPIGREAFVFFVNAENPVANLTVSEIQGIYSGQVTNWRELGGRDEPIRAFQRSEGSGSQTALVALMQGIPLMEPPMTDVAVTMGEIIDRTADYRNEPGAIGYSFRYYATEMAGSGQIRLLALDGIEPTRETIRAGLYPVASQFYAVTAGSENPHVQPFIDWMTSGQGQFLVEQSGYVPIGNSE